MKAFGDRPAAGAAYDARLVRRLWTYIRPQQRLIWISLGLLTVTSCARLALPYLVKIGIDEHIAPGNMEGFWPLLIGFALVAVIEVVGKAFETWTIDKAGQNALLDLRMAVFRHLQRLSSSFYDRTPIGRLVGRVTTDVEALQELFSSGVVTILGDLVFIVATVTILFAMNWKLTLVALLVVPVLLALTLFIRVRVRATYGEMISRRSQLNAFLHEQVAGMPVVQLFLGEPRARSGFGSINAGLRDAQLRSVRWESSLSALTEMLAHFTIALILWYGGSLVLGRDESGLVGGMTLGALFAFIDYMTRFFVPLNDLSLKYTVMQNAMTASERIFGLMDADDVTPEPQQPVVPSSTAGAIEFRGVTFGYDASLPVLRDVDFEVAAGERVAIVGATGSGKTTLLKLLTRLYDVQSGSILLDGVDVTNMSLAELRGRVGIVTQDVFLFEGDLVSNICLGHPEISPEEAIRAADRLRLDSIVARFPRGYREPVRERGTNLSSGERQLVAFARVLAVAPKVLALDEATSNVDTHTEELLQRAVHEIMLGRTALIVAHRLSTIRDVDRILVFQKGRIVEQGRHEDLLARRGVYWRLYRLQYQDQERGVERV